MSQYGSIGVAAFAALRIITFVVRLVGLLADEFVFTRILEVSIIVPELEVFVICSIASDLVKDA